MEERVFYLNGEFVKESEVKLSIYDHGFLYGDAVYDTGRTFNHVPFKLKDHIDRLFASLRYVQIDPRLTPQEIQNITLEVIKRNESTLAPSDDFLFSQRISRGEGLPLSIDPATKPTVLIHCNPIAFNAFAKKYTEGVHLITPQIKHLPPQCLDPRAKVQSRVINVLADLEAKRIDPAAYALMLDTEGFLSEGPSHNFFMAKNGKLFTSRLVGVLEGITRTTVLELAEELDIESVETDLTLFDLYNADEALITATSYEIFPVRQINDRPLEGPIPGPITRQLLSALSRRVGVDIVQQALNHVKPSVAAS